MGSKGKDVERLGRLFWLVPTLPWLGALLYQGMRRLLHRDPKPWAQMACSFLALLVWSLLLLATEGERTARWSGLGFVPGGALQLKLDQPVLLFCWAVAVLAIALQGVSWSRHKGGMAANRVCFLLGTVTFAFLSDGPMTRWLVWCGVSWAIIVARSGLVPGPCHGRADTKGRTCLALGLLGDAFLSLSMIGLFVGADILVPWVGSALVATLVARLVQAWCLWGGGRSLADPTGPIIYIVLGLIPGIFGLAHQYQFLLQGEHMRRLVAWVMIGCSVGWTVFAALSHKTWRAMRFLALAGTALWLAWVSMLGAPSLAGAIGWMGVIGVIALYDMLAHYAAAGQDTADVFRVLHQRAPVAVWLLLLVSLSSIARFLFVDISFSLPEASPISDWAMRRILFWVVGAAFVGAMGYRVAQRLWGSLLPGRPNTEDLPRVPHLLMGQFGLAMVASLVLLAHWGWLILPQPQASALIGAAEYALEWQFGVGKIIVYAALAMGIAWALVRFSRRTRWQVRLAPAGVSTDGEQRFFAEQRPETGDRALTRWQGAWSNGIEGFPAICLPAAVLVLVGCMLVVVVLG